MSRRLRPALYLTGVVVLVGTLLGAKALTAGNAAGDTPKTSAGAPSADTTVIMGTVDSDPPPVPYGLPPVLQSGTVKEVHVKGGDVVEKGDPLYSFDASFQEEDVKRAEVAVLQAENGVKQAEEAKKQHTKKIAVMEQAVEAAASKVRNSASLYNLIKKNIEDGLTSAGGQPPTPEQLKEKLDKNPDLFKANADWLADDNAHKHLQAELDLLKATDVELLVKAAEIAVKTANAELDKATTVRDLCTVRAKTAGVIARVTIAPGATMGVSTRDPALWLIPKGSRIIRGEVEAEFAHRVSDEMVGTEVTILDHTNTNLTYKGTVRRVPDIFLPKRNEGLMQSDTRVLELIVDVTDPAPAGQPPLRVGQRVRVRLGQ